MNRLHSLNVQEATGELGQLFTAIKGAVGKVPNAYATIGSNSPAVLGHVLATSALLNKGSLSNRELEAINLAVSEVSGCDYCLAAHTMTSKMAGYSAAQIVQLRGGAYADDAKVDALVKFAVRLVSTSGTLPADAVDGVRAAGYNDTQIIDAIMAVSAILFTNMVNRVNDTVLDFPKAA